MDAITDILRSMRLTGGVFLDSTLSAPWSFVAQVGPEECRPFMPIPQQLIAYHYVLEGQFFVVVGNEPPMPVNAGQLLIFPRNDMHILTSNPNLKPIIAQEIVVPGPDGSPARLVLDNGGDPARAFCGFLGNNDPSDPLIQNLPAFIQIDIQERLSGQWIEESIKMAMRDIALGGPGASASLARVAELLFAEAVREYIRTQTDKKDGWLAGLKDPAIGRALALLHSRPLDPCTLESLGRETGLSKSSLTDRFRRQIGTSPMNYLKSRRLHVAADRLIDSRAPVSAVALESGYESESAFSRAFKKEFGQSPAAYRAEMQTQTPSW